MINFRKISIIFFSRTGIHSGTFGIIGILILASVRTEIGPDNLRGSRERNYMIIAFLSII